MIFTGLVGHPVKHSLSPWIHGHFFKKSGLKGNYQLFDISPKDFHASIDILKEDLIGFNVTLPYKQKIISKIDELDQSAEKSGAVNTVVKRGNRWIGYNTDGIGYVRSLEKEYPEVFSNQDINVLMIGAGGAARGIFYALLQNGIQNIDLTNRSLERAEQLAQDFSSNSKIYSLQDVLGQIPQYDLIIQTTSVGMDPNHEEKIFSLPPLREGVIVSDIVYRPLNTKFLLEAKRKGANLHKGHTMLLYQALYAFEIWTGKKLMVEGIEKELKTKLKGNDYVNR